MKLTLKKVKQHNWMDLDLPNKGTVLISGRSGSGKTTIFDAIEDCLFGNQQDMKPLTGGSPVMEITIGEVTITRKRNPNSLTVKTKDKEMVGEEAQLYIINNIINVSQEEFETCSYIRQEGAGSLLSLTPAEQMKFIQKLASGDVDPDLIKVKLQAKMVIKQHELDIAISELSIKSKLLLAAEAELNTIFCPPEPEEFDPDQEKTVLALRHLKEQEIADLKIEEMSIKKDINNPLRTMESKLKEKLQAIDNNLQSSNDTLAGIDSKLTLIIIPPKPDNLNSIISDHYKFFECLEKIKAFSKLHSDGSDIKVTEQIKTRLKAEETKLTTLTIEKNNIEQSLKSLTEKQLCPHCEGNLSIKMNKIVKFDQNYDQSELKDRLVIILNDIKSNQTSNLQKLLNGAEALKKELTSYKTVQGINNIEDLKKFEIDYQEKVSIYETLKQQQVIYAKEKGSIILAINQLEVERDFIYADLNQYKELKPIDQLNQRLQEINVLTEDAYKLINQFNNILISIQKSKAEWAEYTNGKTHFVNVLFKKDELEKECSDLNGKLQIINNDYASIKRAIELVQQSATECLEDTINQINANADMYLTRMFPDDGTSIRIRNFSVTQKGDERAKISIELYHKGKEFKKLAQMSGGEKARARLAFQLGLASLYNSPIILIDEGFVGLSDDDKQNCMEVLREVAQDKLVLVIEHGASQEYFDQVINVEEIV